MSDVAALTTLYPLVVPELPSAPDLPLVLQALQRATRDFCEKTGAWREEIAPMVAVDYQQDYTLQNDYSADIERILWVKLQGSARDEQEYELWEDGRLRWRDQWTPVDCDNQLLKCGTIGTAVMATWQAVTAGAFVISIQGQSYTVDGLNFSAASTLDDLARIIQTGLRTEIAESTMWCRVYGATDAASIFYIWTDSGELSVLSAPSSGTDISGSGFLNGLTGTGNIGGRIEAKVVFKPDFAVDALPDWFLNRYHETIVAGAAAILMAVEGKSYSSKDGALKAQRRYNSGIALAISDVMREFKQFSGDFYA